MKRRFTGCVAMLFAAWMVACGARAEETPGPSSVGPEDLAASPIARLAKAIEDGDAETVSASVSYPLKREAPLPAIDNAEEFVAYFPILFDEAFRRRMREGRFSDDWDEMGCNGVMYRNGTMWVDGTLADGGNIISVHYQSDEEKRLRKARVEAERATLHPSFAGTCDTMLCFETDDREIAGRVDRMENGDFRVLLYDGQARTGQGIPRGTGKPRKMFQATAIYDGSGGNHVYLDRFGEYVLDVTVLGLPETPELEFHERLSFYDAFDEGRPAHYADWFDLLAPADPSATDGASAE